MNNDELAAALLDEAISERVGQAGTSLPSLWMAKIVAKGPDGTLYADIVGGERRVPCQVAQVTADVGDTVEVRFQDGRVIVTANRTDPPPASSNTTKLEEKVVETRREVQIVKTEKADVTDLTAAKADISQLRSGFAEFETVVTDDLLAAKGRIDDLEADHVSTTDLQAVNGDITNLKAKDATIEGNVSAATGRIGTLETENTAVKGRLTAAEGNITTLQSTKADISVLESDYAQIDLANVNNAYIKNGVFDKAAVFDAAVFDLTGDTATIKEINADDITVRNLHTKNLTVDTADGYVTIGSKKTPTKEFIDSLKDELQQEIDGAVETWTSTAVPLLNNYPANQWADDKTKAKHVGDICYVQKTGDEHDGFCYRFSYDSTSQQFSWVLIKDSSVTKALGDISDLKTFQSDTTQWIEETDEGLTQIRENHTELSGVVDGVKTTADAALPASTFTQFESTTFKTVKDTVDSQSTKFEQLTTTLGTNADGTTKENDIVHRTSAIEQDVSGFKTTVSETYATKSEAKQTDSDSGKRVIVTEDAAELPLLTLTAYGECEQDGTPIPDSPVAIKAVRGRNLIYGTQFRVGAVENAATMSQTVEDGMFKMVISDGNTANWNSQWYSEQTDTWALVENTLSEGDPFTVSFLMRAVGSTVKPTIYLKQGMGYYTMQGTLSEEWSVLSYSGTWKDANSMRPHLGWAGVRTASTYYIKAWQIEYGSCAHHIVPRGSIAAVTTGKNLATANSVSAGNIGNLSSELLPGTYTLSLESDTTSGGLNIRLTGETVNLGTIYFSSSTVGVRQSKTFTIDHVGTLAFNGWGGWTAYPHDIQLELGTEATAYEPYRESVSYIDLQGHELASLPDGTRDELDIDAAGVKTIGQRVGVVDLGTLSWFAIGAGSPNFRFGVQFPETVKNGAILCTGLQATTYVNMYNHVIDNSIAIHPNVAQLEAYSSAYTDVAAFKAAMSGVLLYYELATSQAVDLGYIDMPTTFDGGTVHVDAEIQPVIDASWWTEAGYETGKAYNDGNGSADLAALTERVTTAESSITQQAGQIASKVSQSDFNTLSGRVDTAESTITQHSNDIEAKVSKNGVIAAINLSTETEGGSAVKIRADKVQIDGTAIFLAISDDVDDAITDKGYQTASQVNTAITSKGYQTSSQVESAITSKGYATTSQAQGYANTAESNAKADTASKLTSYSTTNQMNEAIQNATGPLFYGKENATGYIHLGHVPYVVSSTSNYSHLHLTGRIGGWLSTTSGSIDITFKSRADNAAYNTVDRKDDTVNTSFVDVLVYTGTDGFTHYWLKVNSYWYAQLYAEFEQFVEDDHTRTTTEPDGTCVWKLSEHTAVAAPKANAVKRTQRIYWRSASSLSSWSMPTAWLTVGNDGSHQFGKWTTKVPRMTANADGTGTKYPYLYTCEQREMADGTLAYTTVLLDDSATIIDGGNIITGSLDANKITSGTLTVGHVTNLQSTLDGKASTTVGNPNISPYFEYTPFVNKSNGGSYWHYVNGFVPMENGWAKGTSDNTSGTANAYINMREQAIDALKPSTVYTAMLEVRNYSGSGTTSWVVPHRTASGQVSSFAVEKRVAINKDGVYRLEITSLSDLSNVNEGCSAYIQINAGARISLECRMSLYEGEYDGPWKPYSGSQLYTTDGIVDGKIASVEIGGRNLIGSTDNPTVPTGVNSMAKMTFGDIGQYNNPESEFSIEDYDGSANSIVITSSRTGNCGVCWYTKAGEVKAGASYTFSCRVKSSIAVSVHTHTAWRNGSATAGYTGWTSAGSMSIAANTWTDYSFTFVPASNANLDYEFLVAICFAGNSSGVTFHVAHAKFEKGNKATDWTPAPEDPISQDQVEGLDDDLTDLSNSIQQTSENLSDKLDNELGSFVPDKEKTMEVWGKLTAEEIDVNTLRGLILQAANLILGNPDKVHIDASGAEMAFMNGLDKVAYIDAATGTFYMTKSVVLDDMYFGDGKWKWYKRSNNNMSVKWMG